MPQTGQRIGILRLPVQHLAVQLFRASCVARFAVAIRRAREHLHRGVVGVEVALPRFGRLFVPLREAKRFRGPEEREVVIGIDRQAPSVVGERGLGCAVLALEVAQADQGVTVIGITLQRSRITNAMRSLSSATRALSPAK